MQTANICSLRNSKHLQSSKLTSSTSVSLCTCKLRSQCKFRQAKLEQQRLRLRFPDWCLQGSDSILHGVNGNTWSLKTNIRKSIPKSVQVRYQTQINAASACLLLLGWNILNRYALNAEAHTCHEVRLTSATIVQ